MDWDKTVIINAAIGGWYPRGQRRLRRSLIEHGYHGEMMFWDKWPNDNFDKSCVYNVKAAAFEEAIAAGFTNILWIDCSGWVIADPTPIFQQLDRDGYFILQSGYNCAQVCSDACLGHFGIDRDKAETINDSSTITFGVRIGNPIADDFIARWLNSAMEGAFHGNRVHDAADSTDKRFLFHRQDQACASLAAYLSGVELTPFGGLCAYYEKQLPESVCLVYRGC